VSISVDRDSDIKEEVVANIQDEDTHDGNIEHSQQQARASDTIDPVLHFL